MFEFGAIPPEITSALMYSGPGSGPMMAAASAWSNLAAELNMTASSSESVISRLTGDEWLGPASASMTTATQPYIAWMTNTAAAAEQAAGQAMASAAAFETAFAAIVPPEVIAANRTLLATLVATNFLGINTPAIMATEAHYAEMWVQDAVAMYGYAGASASAGTLQPLTPAPPTTNVAGAALQGAAISNAAAGGVQMELSSVVSGLQGAVGSLASPLTAAGGVGGMLNGFDSFLGIPVVFNGVQQVGVTAAWFVGNTIPTAVAGGHTLATTPAAALASDVEGSGAGLAGGTVLANAVGPAGTAAPAGFGGVGGGPVLAGLARAGSVGGLSVPAAWSAATPAGTGSATLAGSGWTAAAEESTPVATVPAGMPSVASAGRGAGFGAPRYGFKPTVMPKQVIV